MNDNPLQRTSFLASSEEPTPDAFYGYFFHESDYVFGNSGFQQFLNGGVDLTHSPRLDGCYVRIVRDDQGLSFYTDHSGYKALYYFSDGPTWAVSDSFARLVRHLRKLNVRITPNYCHLSSINSTNSTNNQLFSWNTPVRGVKVLPRGHSLHVHNDKIAIAADPKPPSHRYAPALAKHLDLWISRIETILSNTELQLTVDLTGGVDSRTNFALAIAAYSRSNASGSRPRITCQGTPGKSLDHNVATDLCSEYGFSLNEGNRVAPVRLTPAQGFHAWEDMSLGVYYPLVIPTTHSSPNRIHLNGGGGEVHRDFYLPSSVEGFFAGHASRSLYPWLGNEAAQDGYLSASTVANTYEEPIMRAHYREFRHRYHVGRLPRQSVSFTPLDSATAELAHSDEERNPTGAQFNFDVLASLEHQLLLADFDRKDKAPTAHNVNELTVVPLSEGKRSGRVWLPGESLALNSGRSYSMQQRVEPFIDAVSRAENNDFVRAFCGPDLVHKAHELLSKIHDGGSIGNPVNGYPVSTVLTSELVSPIG